MADTAVARTTPKKRLPNTGYSSTTAIPRPMMASTSPGASPGPEVSLSPNGLTIAPLVSPPATAEETEGSPKLLVADPPSVPGELEELERKKSQDEDQQAVSDERENDIYAEAALSCSIENKEACMMCSG